MLAPCAPSALASSRPPARPCPSETRLLAQLAGLVDRLSAAAAAHGEAARRARVLAEFWPWSLAARRALDAELQARIAADAIRAELRGMHEAIVHACAGQMVGATSHPETPVVRRAA